MVKIYFETEIQALKESLEKVYKALRLIALWYAIDQSPYQVTIGPDGLYENRNMIKTRPTLPLTEDVKEKNKLLINLLSNIESFLRSNEDNIETNMKSLISLRKSVKTFMDNYNYSIERDPVGFEHVTEFFRILFNYIDRFISWLSGAEKTFAETYTPGAQTLKGRYNFFSRPETELGTLLKDFEHACNNLESNLDIH